MQSEFARNARLKIPDALPLDDKFAKEMLARQYRLLIQNSRESFELNAKKQFQEAMEASIIEQQNREKREDEKLL